MSDSPRFFKTPAAFRLWLKRNGSTETELVVGLHKKGSGLGGITYAEALDEALCFGWIDGVRKSLNADNYTIRFTPRKSRSVWSLVNLRHAERLKKTGRMNAAGLAAFETRDANRTGIYSFEQRKAMRLAPALVKQLRTDKAAWTFFSAQPPGYRSTAVFWVMSAKREETRLRRLGRLMADSTAGRRLPMLTGKKKV